MAQWLGENVAPAEGLGSSQLFVTPAPWALASEGTGTYVHIPTPRSTHIHIHIDMIKICL